MQKKIENLEKGLEIKKNSKEEDALIKRVYEEFSSMRDVLNKSYKNFNDRNLLQFIDDSEKRFIGYVPSRKSQGKEKWQSNFFHPVTRNKTLAILASVALDVPPTRITAVNEKNEVNMKVANIVSDLVKASYNNINKEEESFFEALESVTKGTVIGYDGYLKTKVKRKEITSFDILTGEVEYEEKDVIIDEGCKSFIIPLENFFVYSAFIRNLQDQPAVIWVQYMNTRDFAYEFGNYANFKYVHTANELLEKDIQKRFFYEDWNTRTKERPIEVVRYFNKINDEQIIIANGVKLLNAPMLLGRKKKYYPFFKSGYSPFNSEFFWMNSLPNMLMGEQDVLNSFHNMMADKTYKGLVTNLLIGNTNKDDFDLEDEEVTLDTKIYVQDINQVREMPNSGVTSAEFNMLQLISSGVDLSSVDSAQQGVQGSGVTAREVVIANENARKLKGVFFLFITSWWLQKSKIRTLNVLTYSTSGKVNAVVGEDKAAQFKKFIAEGVELSDGTKGNKGIIIAKDEKSLPTQEEIDQNVEEYKAVNPGVNYEEIAVTSSYINEWEYKIKIVSEDMYQKDSSYSVSKNEDKLRVISSVFPAEFEKNKKKLFKDTLIAYNDDVDEYDMEEEKPPVVGVTDLSSSEAAPQEEGMAPPEESLPIV